MIDWAQDQIEASRYDNWELYFLLIAVGLGAGIVFRIDLITNFLYWLDGVDVVYGYTTDQILIAAIQGIVLSIIGSMLFSQGDSYFAFITDSFNTKETTFLVRVGLMTFLSIAVTIVLPEFIYAHSEFVVVQTLGVVVFLGYYMIHNDIGNWKISNEAPVLLAGFVLFAAPLL
jgi:hypothetical protein